MYKALVTDLDGTAVIISSDGSDVDDATKQAVKSAIDNGKKISCATGREWKVAKDVVTALGFVSPCIVEGGTRIINPKTEKTLWEKSLANNIPLTILEIFKTENDHGFVTHSADISRQELESVKSVPEALRYIYLLAVEEDVAVKISNRINAEPFAVAHFTPSWYGSGLVDIHVTHPDATKENAIKVWQGLEAVSQEETIGMGDSGNDIPIFLSSGYKVAASNATANVKALADYIIPSQEQHALKHVIDKLLLMPLSASETTSKPTS